MEARPVVEPEVLASLPASVMALLAWQAEEIRRLSAKVDELMARVVELEGTRGKDSTNSSKPPSTEHPHAKPKSDKPKSPLKRGAQPGHDKHERKLIPTEECQEVVTCIPTACRRCGGALQGVDPQPLRQQVGEIPEIRLIVTEYQRHRLTCACGCTTCGPLPPGVPDGQAGPRLVALTALLMANYRQSKRRTAEFLTQLLNRPASPGWIVKLQERAAEAVAPAYAEMAALLPKQDVLAIDESPTKQANAKAWVWTFVAQTFTFFACRTSRAAEVLKQLLGQPFDGKVHCDRAKMYWCLGRLQWCWAHLKRDFQALIDSACHTKRRLGRDLMEPTLEMFGLWKKVRDGTLERKEFGELMKPIRARVGRLLLRGYCNPKTRRWCAELVQHQDRLWTFVDCDGVEPTNNAAERALRHAVIWRKLSFGTQSESGSRFVERMLTVVETCRRQKTNAYAWLTRAVHAHFSGQKCPSLITGA